MEYSIEDFIEETSAAQSRDEAFALYCKAIQRLGFDSAVYTFLTDHLAAGQPAGHGVQCNYPGDWMAYYREKDYQAIDPVILRVKKTVAPFRWEDLAETGALSQQQGLILHEAQDAGLHCGIGIPLYGPRGELAGLGLASSLRDAHPDKITLCKLKLLAEQLHLVYCSLSAPAAPRMEADPAKRLTPREVEILKWYGEGKTADEIGLILGCRKPTVKWHIHRVYDKLEVHNRAQAVTQAIRLGYLTLGKIKVV